MGEDGFTCTILISQTHCFQLVNLIVKNGLVANAATVAVADTKYFIMTTRWEDLLHTMNPLASLFR